MVSRSMLVVWKPPLILPVKYWPIIRADLISDTPPGLRSYPFIIGNKILKVAMYSL